MQLPTVAAACTPLRGGGVRAEDAQRCDCNTLRQALSMVPGAARMVVGHTIQVRPAASPLAQCDMRHHMLCFKSMCTARLSQSDVDQMLSAAHLEVPRGSRAQSAAQGPCRKMGL